MSDLRVGLIGYGLAGRAFHAQLIAATEGMSVTAIVTSNPARREEAAREHPDARLLATPAELWDIDHDLVVIATPSATHAELAHQAIDHGVAVLVDKPLAVTAAGAEAVLEHADRAGILLTVFQNRRWDSDQLTLRRLLSEDRLGSVLRYESRFERWRPQAEPGAWRAGAAEAGGGYLLDLGAHLVDQALCLFGPVTRVYGEVAALRGIPADDDAFLALRHADGVISHLHVSAVTAAPGPRLRVLGSKAAFVVHDLGSQEDELRAGLRPDMVAGWGEEPESRWGRLVAGDESRPVPSERGDWPRFYALLTAALRDGGPPPVDPRDAVRTLHIIEAGRESAATHSIVALEDRAVPTG